MVQQSWIINCLKMYKISDEVKNLIEKTMNIRRPKLTAGGKSFAESKIQRSIFQGDAQGPLLNIPAMISINHTLRKCTPGYKFIKSQEKINQLMYIKLFTKKQKRIENSDTQSENLQSEHSDGIWHRKMHHASNEKQKTTL